MQQTALFPSPAPTHDPGGKCLPLPPGVIASAVYAGPLDCYRHRLEWRRPLGPALMCIGMNPSTAGHLNGDATVCKLHRMAACRGFGALLMANVHGYRATDQRRLAEVEDPIGPDNLGHVLVMASQAVEIWVCYGTPKLRALRENGPTLCRKLVAVGHKLHALRVSEDGTPHHPLYLPETLEPFPWEPPHAG